MTPEETAKALNELAKSIAEETPDMVQESALTAKALIQERIQELGEDSNEVSLNPYSESYKKIRQKRGFEVGHVNLTFTGQMWRGTRIISEGATSNGYEVIIGGSDPDSKNKLGFNSEHYGDVLRLAKKEEAKLQAGINDRLNELVKQAGL